MRSESERLIAIVEDDIAVRMAIASLVRSMGLSARVFDSANGFLQSPEVSDMTCLISDVRMPDLSGVAMHDRLIQRGYALPTIFITAFPTAILDAKRTAAGVVAILYKPIDASEMVDCVTRALDLA